MRDWPKSELAALLHTFDGPGDGIDQDLIADRLARHVQGLDQRDTGASGARADASPSSDLAAPAAPKRPR